MGHKKKKERGGEKKCTSQERPRAMGNCAPKRAKGQRKNPPQKKKQPKMGQEQWVTVPPPPLHYLVMSLMVTKQKFKCCR